METPYWIANGLAHPLHLVLSAFVQDELEPGRTELPDPRGGRSSVVEFDAFGEAPERFGTEISLDICDVHLVHLVPRMGKPVRKRAVVREEESSGGVRVEPSDGDDAALMADEADDRRTPVRIAGGRDDAGWLVEEDVGQGLRLDGVPIDLDPVAGRDEGGEPGRLAVDLHAARANQLLRGTT